MLYSDFQIGNDCGLHIFKTEIQNGQLHHAQVLCLWLQLSTGDHYIGVYPVRSVTLSLQLVLYNYKL